MAILNVGSINWDTVLRVPHLPHAGETIVATSSARGLGGKGLNQSVAIVRAGGRVCHVGAVGGDDASILAAIEAHGIATSLVVRLGDALTGSATIMVDDRGENVIVVDAGANRRIPEDTVMTALAGMRAGDWLLVQNETNLIDFSLREARARGLKTAFAAAPFDAAAVMPLIGTVDLLAVNAVEYAQLCDAAGGADSLPVATEILVTMGGKGAELHSAGRIERVDALRVDAQDTTGAGDTFFGYFLACRDQGADTAEALATAAAAAALQVTRPGAADAIPARDEVDAFRAALGQNAAAARR